MSLTGIPGFRQGCTACNAQLPYQFLQGFLEQLPKRMMYLNIMKTYVTEEESEDSNTTLLSYG